MGSCKGKTKYCKTDIEKALVVHEHLCDTIVYSSRLQAAAHDIEGAIFEKEAVCEGYALAYKYYMNRLGNSVQDRKRNVKWSVSCVESDSA